MPVLKRPFQIAFTVLLAIIVVTAVSLFERWRLEREQIDQIESKASDLDQLLRRFAVLPVILSEDPRLQRALTEPSAQSTDIANRVLEHVALESDAAFAFLMDSSGLTVSASNYAEPVSFVGNNYGFRPYFKQAIVGESATFFAIGATTGIPGYFVSEPVFYKDRVIGVIVVKLEPNHLPVSWNADSSIALVTDDLGVVILSSKQKNLYSVTQPLNENVLSIIKADRRYQISEQSQFNKTTESRWKFVDDGESSNYFVQSRLLEVEPWTMSVLTPVYTLILRIAIKLAVLTGIAVIAGLIWKIWSQQAQISRERAQLAKSLEQQVQERTLELEQIQADMISQSNFAMLGRMSAAINHEVNQPLSSLRLNLAALRQMIERSDGSANAQEGAKQDNDTIESTVIDLDRTAKRITRVIESLRALPNRQKTDFSEISVHELLRDTIETIERERPVMSKFLKYSQVPSVHTGFKIIGERVLLQQAVLNVVYNAFDAVSECEEPSIQLNLQGSEESVAIVVADNGEGVLPHMVSRMFEPFESSPEKVAGLGLGLTLAKQIVTDHGGQIQFERKTTPEALSVFTISLPAVDITNARV